MTPNIVNHKGIAIYDFSIASSFYCKGEVFFELR